MAPPKTNCKSTGGKRGPKVSHPFRPLVPDTLCWKTKVLPVRLSLRERSLHPGSWQEPWPSTGAEAREHRLKRESLFPDRVRPPVLPQLREEDDGLNIKGPQQSEHTELWQTEEALHICMYINVYIHIYMSIYIQHIYVCIHICIYIYTLIWVVVKIMVPFWIPNIVRHLIFRVPQKGP